MTLLLDTTVLIDVLRGVPKRRAQLTASVLRGDVLATSAINVAEVYAGMRPEEAERTEVLLSSLEVYATTGAIARRAGRWKREFARRGVTLTLMDTLVAATAMEHDAALVTDNVTDFPMEGLRVV